MDYKQCYYNGVLYQDKDEFSYNGSKSNYCIFNLDINFLNNNYKPVTIARDNSQFVFVICEDDLYLCNEDCTRYIEVFNIAHLIDGPTLNLNLIMPVIDMIRKRYTQLGKEISDQLKQGKQTKRAIA